MDQKSEAYLQRIRSIVLQGIPAGAAEVYLFGSYATGHARQHSDVDVAVIPGESFDPGCMGKIREALEESTVPFRVDLIDASMSGEIFQARVRSEGVRWTA